ncbi:MerR family transcriptional regulator [Nonomuraea turcica]|uniref:MerR family transcriptional regulator n=1 Tax=Nonomuraea sp. G32 TaxID=3067274 RepID=UPI00353028F9
MPTLVLRHWEGVALLAVERHRGGERRYGAAYMRRVAMILMGMEARLGLRELSQMLASLARCHIRT